MMADAVQGARNRRAGLGREVLLAAVVYAPLLLLAVSSDYARGRGLYNGVIWDPIPLYQYAPMDQVGSRALHQGFFLIWDPTRGLGDCPTYPSGSTLDNPLKFLAYIFNTRLSWELYLGLRLFLAGIFCFIAARKLGASFAGSLLAGTSYMLCGFFREFHNFQELDLETLMPLFILFLLLMARRPRLLYFTAAIVLGQFLDTQPVAYFYMYLLAVLLYLFTAAARASRSGRALRAGASRILLLGVAMTGAVLAAANYLLPVTEFFAHGWTYHPADMGDLRVPLSSAIAMVTPLFDYWIKSAPNLEVPHLEQLTLTPAYFGAVTSVLAVGAVVRARRLPAAGLAFVAAAPVFAGFVFGVPPFSLLLKLPIIRYFQTFRYAQPALALCMAMLAGFGLDRLTHDRAGRRLGLVIATVIVLWIAAHLFIFRRELLGGSYLLSGLGAAMAGTALIAAVAWRKGKADVGRAVAGGLVALNGLELVLCFNLAMPVYGPAAFDVSKPGAVDFLQAQREQGPFRIFGTDQRIVHPNLAGVYGLDDLRDTTPIFPRDYAELMAALNGWKGEEVAEQYLAHGRFYFDLDFNRIPARSLDMLNVRYVLSHGDPLARPAIRQEQEGEEITAPGPEYVSAGDLTIGGVARTGFLLHAPARAAAQAEGSGRVWLDAGVLGRARECSGTDGVDLMLTAGGAGKERLEFARHFNAERDRAWTPVEFNLDSGGLALASLPGPRDDRRCDFGAWSTPEFEAGRDGFHLVKVYDREMRVYENRSVLPRVFAVEELEHVADDYELARKLRGGDPARTAWLTGPGGLERKAFTSAAIAGTREGWGALSFTAQAAGPAFAVVSDLYYPGFKALVNGQETRIWKVDGALRGIELPPGASRVEMIYVPASFCIALWCRIAVVLAGTIALMIAFKRRASQS